MAFPSAVSCSLCISLQSPVHSSSRREWTTQPQFIALKSQLRSIHEILYSTNQGTLRALYKFITRNNPFSVLHATWKKNRKKRKHCRKHWKKAEWQGDCAVVLQKLQILQCTALSSALCSTGRRWTVLLSILHRRGMCVAKSEIHPLLKMCWCEECGCPKFSWLNLRVHSRSIERLSTSRILNI